MKAPRQKTARHKRAAPALTRMDWRDIYDALMDAAEAHHSGPRADRILALARKVREALP